MKEDISFKITKGVCLVEVCGEAVLVSTREARGKCPSVQLVNSAAAYYWSLIEQGFTYGQIIQHAAGEFTLEEMQVAAAFDQFVEALTQNGYLIAERHTV